MRKIELLAPAKDAECGISAVKCGADAVYIGGNKFGARAAAGNETSDIENLIRFAHRYRAKVYIALNTILTDAETPEAAKMAKRFHELGADALIVQDMGLVEYGLPPMPVIASTQTHNADWKKVEFLEKAGFSRAILARELSLDEIRLIRSKTHIELETFVHGALCVSYSGQCYLSYACYGRSGNRGECAQPCRMTYSLLNESGKTLVRDRYLLSLKDLNLSEHLKDLIDAGVDSFKIEGRLKDENYIRNVVSFYRRKLDDIIDGKQFERPSLGKSFIAFEPDPVKSFSRGFTTYNLIGREPQVASYYTQKSIGEYIGTVKTARSTFFTLEGKVHLHNGDGICFIDASGELGGTNIETVEDGKVFPHEGRFIRTGYSIYRNSDHDFNKLLTRGTVERKIPVELEFGETEDGFYLEGGCSGLRVRQETAAEKKPAEKPEMALETIRKNLTKFGDSQFDCEDLKVAAGQTWFLPVSILNQLRRDWAQAMEDEIVHTTVKGKPASADKDYPYPEKILKFGGNVLNRYARTFYKRHGVLKIEDAAESGVDLTGEVVMTTKHCLKYQLGRCVKYPMMPDPALKIPANETEPFYLSDGKRLFLLRFDCSKCVMEVVLTDKKPPKDFEKSYRDGILKKDLKTGAPQGQKYKGRRK